MVSFTLRPQTSAMHKISGAESSADAGAGSAADGAQQILVIRERQVGIEAALHEDPGAAQRDGLFDFFSNSVK